MPLTQPLLTSSLAIALVPTPQGYCPGQTIIGQVQRSDHVVSTEARVVVTLFGRIKTKVVQNEHGPNNNSRRRVYRDRYQIIGLAQQIFQGPLHIPPNSDHIEAWPFNITIPTHSQRQGDAELTPLPPSFSNTYHGFGGQWEGFIEYYLQAELSISVKGSWKREEALLPIKIRAFTEGPQLVDFTPVAHQDRNQMVTSQRLVPGMEDAQLSASQKMKKFFGSSSVPKFGFTITVIVPTVIQLENQNPLPLSIRVTPDPARTGEEIRDVPQKVFINMMNMQLLCGTQITYQRTFGPSMKDTSDTVDLYIWNLVKGRTNDDHVELTCSNKSEGLFDLGQLIQLRLGYNGTKGIALTSPKTGESLEMPEILFPNLQTRQIQHWHTLRWELSGKIAGEKFSSKGHIGVHILPPSGSSLAPPPVGSPAALPVAAQGTVPGPGDNAWIHPPDIDEPPPAFEDVQKEGVNDAKLINDDEKGAFKDEKKGQVEHEKTVEDQNGEKIPS